MTIFEDFTPHPPLESYVVYRRHKPTFKEKVQNAIAEIKIFIYETPVWVIAALVLGIALLIFRLASYAAPCLGLAVSATLARLLIKVLKPYDSQQMKRFKEKLYLFQQKHPWIQYVALLIVLVVTAFFPIGGAIIAALLGIYKGITQSYSTFKYQQTIRREELENPTSNIEVQLNDC